MDKIMRTTTHTDIAAIKRIWADSQTTFTQRTMLSIFGPIICIKRSMMLITNAFWHPTRILFNMFIAVIDRLIMGLTIHESDV
jgi:hypothetical protein